MTDETVITDTRPTFFSGWRPAFGYVSLIGLTIQFVLVPIIEVGGAVINHPITLPRLDINQLITMTTGILALGGMRTVEKVTSSTNNH